jgi:hypothetical protein
VLRSRRDQSLAIAMRYFHEWYTAVKRAGPAVGHAMWAMAPRPWPKADLIGLSLGQSLAVVPHGHNVDGSRPPAPPRDIPRACGPSRHDKPPELIYPGDRGPVIGTRRGGRATWQLGLPGPRLSAAAAQPAARAPGRADRSGGAPAPRSFSCRALEDPDSPVHGSAAQGMLCAADRTAVSRGPICVEEFE